MKKSILLIALAAMLLTGCAAGGSEYTKTDTQTSAGEPPAVSQENTAIPFAAQYIRTGGYVSGKKYPVITVIRSLPELTDYFVANRDSYDLGDNDGIRFESSGGETFIDVAGKYDEDYFKDNALILILIEEPSGSISHNVSSVTAGSGGIDVTIERLLPEEWTDDMAEWHIFVEISSGYAAGEARVKLADKHEAENSSEVPFAVKYIKTAGYFQWPTAIIMRTTAGLYEYYTGKKDEYFLSSDQKELFNAPEYFSDAIKKYDISYFEDKALILVRLADADPRSYSVKSVTASGSDITVTLERTLNEHLGVSASWHYLIEISKDHLTDELRLRLRTITASQESEIPFAAQYIRTGGYVSGKEYPVTTVIHSVSELEEYYTANKDTYSLGSREEVYSDSTIRFADAMEKYGGEYFKDNVLILILIEEPSGSISHNVSSVIADSGGVNITIERLQPEVQTCDMAEWHIFVEIAKDKAQDSVTVTLADINI